MKDKQGKCDYDSGPVDSGYRLGPAEIPAEALTSNLMNEFENGRVLVIMNQIQRIKQRRARRDRLNHIQWSEWEGRVAVTAETEAARQPFVNKLDHGTQRLRGLMCSAGERAAFGRTQSRTQRTMHTLEFLNKGDSTVTLAELKKHTTKQDFAPRASPSLTPAVLVDTLSWSTNWSGLGGCQGSF